ncbi:hypothetical protein GRX03_11440 [Halovenus sp. WSH3]|uniref:Uncharacterized protein n=1 Tax=Halovenus carboxidivorans TaxID=2692199 RepID=A0A6B0TA22_9EURY|nr:hypothetical protein [Halovenus carboxidivorans]MXR52212.1 hypothetical protein [Halovenus carboxidivorans]
MADLIPGEDGRRGQIVLLSAFILAVAFVALALVVNSAIFTENLATRDDVPGSQDALEYRYEVTRTVGAAVAGINDDPDRSPSEITAAVREINRRSGTDQSVLGQSVVIEYESHDLGTRLAQDSAGQFTDANGDTDWTLAGTVHARNVVFNVTSQSALRSSNPFTFVAGDGSDEWRMNISEDGGNVTVEVETPAGERESCTRDLPEQFTVDVTAGTIDGEPCYALIQQTSGERMHFATGLGDAYDIEIRNGDAIEGTYSMIVNSTSVSGGQYDSYPDDPYTAEAIYSVRVNYEFFTSQVGYQTEIVVAPGEVPP